MATPTNQTKCSISPCDETNTYSCRGCFNEFCFEHLAEHRLFLKEQLALIQDDFNQFRQNLIDMKNNSQKHPLIKQIDQWENESIRKIKDKANQSRQSLDHYIKQSIDNTERKLNEQLNLNEQQKKISMNNSINMKRFSLNKNQIHLFLEFLFDSLLKVSFISFHIDFYHFK